MRVGLIHKDKDLFIGSEQYPNRKRPALIVKRGNSAFVIGYFKNDACVDYFQKALFEFFNKEENK